MVSAFDLGSLPFTSRRPCKDQFGEWTRLSQPCSSTGISITTYIQNFDTIVIKRPKMQMHGVPENGGVTTTFQQHHHLQNFLFMVIVASAIAVTHADLVDLHGVTTTKLEMENRRNLGGQLLRKLSFF
jgi:hypothetical protein